MLRLDPWNEDAYYFRAYAYHAKAEYDKAIADRDRLLRINSLAIAYLCARGYLIPLFGDLRPAITDFNTARLRYHGASSAYYAQGHSRMSKCDGDKALADFTTAIHRDPTNAELYFARGTAHHNMGNLRHAAADYSEAIRLDPQMMQAYCNRAGVYHALGQEGKALVDYTRAIHVDSRSSLPYGNRALIFAASPSAGLRDGKRAWQDARKACELTDWKDAWSLDLLAAAYAEAGDFKQAIAWEKKALSIAEGLRKEEILRGPRARLKLYEKGKPYRENVDEVRDPKFRMRIEQQSPNENPSPSKSP